MWGKNKTNVSGHNKLVFPEPNLKRVPFNDAQMNKDALEDDEQQNSVERHTASETYKLGENARAKLHDELLDKIYKAINEATEIGRLSVCIEVNYIEYQGVMKDALKELVDNEYHVTENINGNGVFGIDELVYQQYLITVNWDKNCINKEV